ncbi:unnamed protein product [Cercospora beticola]|nr:unnamed protein product [Cercospora beticola]
MHQGRTALQQSSCVLFEALGNYIAICFALAAWCKDETTEQAIGSVNESNICDLFGGRPQKTWSVTRSENWELKSLFEQVEEGWRSGAVWHGFSKAARGKAMK